MADGHNSLCLLFIDMAGSVLSPVPLIPLWTIPMGPEIHLLGKIQSVNILYFLYIKVNLMHMHFHSTTYF